MKRWVLLGLCLALLLLLALWIVPGLPTRSPLRNTLYLLGYAAGSLTDTNQPYLLDPIDPNSTWSLNYSRDWFMGCNIDYVPPFNAEQLRRRHPTGVNDLYEFAGRSGSEPRAVTVSCEFLTGATVGDSVSFLFGATSPKTTPRDYAFGFNRAVICRVNREHGTGERCTPLQVFRH